MYRLSSPNEQESFFRCLVDDNEENMTCNHLPLLRRNDNMAFLFYVMKDAAMWTCPGTKELRKLAVAQYWKLVMDREEKPDEKQVFQHLGWNKLPRANFIRSKFTYLFQQANREYAIHTTRRFSSTVDGIGRLDKLRWLITYLSSFDCNARILKAVWLSIVN